MKRPGPARPPFPFPSRLPFSGPILLGCLILSLIACLLGCGSNAPKTSDEASTSSISSTSPAAPPGPSSLGRPSAGEPDPSTSADQVPGEFSLPTEPPYPEARDTLSWDVPWTGPGDNPGTAGKGPTGDSTLGTARGRPPSHSLPSGSRPEGIIQRPRPKGLPDRVHVLLSNSPKAISLYSLGDMQFLSEGIAESGAGKTVTVSKLATLKGRIVVLRSGAGFAIEQSGKASVTTSARKLRLMSVNPYNLVDVNGSVYRGSLHLIGESDGDISTVNVLGVEDYLRGVLPYELGTVDREALEALKAQAIVARTYAYKRMMRPGTRDFHLYSDVQDQVYKGVQGEYLLSDRAVWETRGMAVGHADSLAICYYFSTCSGRTASKHEVWGGDSIPYLVSRPDNDVMGDPYCQASRYSSWKEEWSGKQLSGILRRNLRSASVADAPDFTTLQGIEVAQRASCGRIRLLTLKTDKGSITVKGDKVRWALRPGATENKILPSSSFIVKMVDGKVTAQGKAFGHGVGLCQFGSIARARANQTYKQIIEAYYTGVHIVEFR